MRNISGVNHIHGGIRGVQIERNCAELNNASAHQQNQASVEEEGVHQRAIDLHRVDGKDEEVHADLGATLN